MSKPLRRFKLPRRNSPGCVMLSASVVLAVIGSSFSVWTASTLVIGGDLDSGSVLALIVFLIVGLFMTLCAVGLFMEAIAAPAELGIYKYDADRLGQAGKFTRNERRMLDGVKKDVEENEFAAMSTDELARILGEKDGARVKLANAKLQPIAFTLRPTSALRYMKGVVVEILMWVGLVLSIPILAVVVYLDAPSAWSVGKGVIYRAMRVGRRARRYRVRPHNILRHDEREPILYLRAFSEDYREKIDSYLPATTEEKIASFYHFDYGPVLAIGQPKEDIPLLGSLRIYFDDDDTTWRAGALYLMSVARLVIVQAGFAPGLLWELGVARRRLESAPHKLIISFAAWEGTSPQERHVLYVSFKKYAEELLGCELPPELGRFYYIHFKDGWAPELQ